jgi:hypothetical protein
MPGAGRPTIDIVPLGIVAAMLLFYDAARRPQLHGLPWVATVGKLAIAGGLFMALFVLTPWDGRAGIAAAAVVAVGIASLAFWAEE